MAREKVAKLECKSGVFQEDDGTFSIIVTTSGFLTEKEANDVSFALPVPFSYALMAALEDAQDGGMPEERLHS